MSPRRYGRHACTTFLAALALAAATVASGAPAGHGGDATASPAAVERPVQPASRGAVLYAAQCARCHGADARGDGPDAAYFVRPPRDLRSGFLAVYDDEELVARIRDGAPLRLEFQPQAMRERARDTGALIAFLHQLPEIDWSRVEAGNEIYLDRCEICHGPFGRPAPGMPLPPGVQRPPRDLSSPEFQRAFSDRELRAAVAHGRAGMPAIPTLQSPADAELLVAFVRTLSPGRELYGAYCAGCHGEDGRGGLAVGPDQPTVVFDRAYFRRRDPEDVATSVWHMLDRESPAMPHFSRRLTAAEAAEIVAYLRRSGAAPRPSASPHGSDREH